MSSLAFEFPVCVANTSMWIKGWKMKEVKPYLKFTMRSECFAVELSLVTEVILVPKNAFMPWLPTYLSGVLRHRGSVVPLLDMGMKLELVRIVPTVKTAAIIIDCARFSDKGACESLGLVVDSVQELVHIDHASLEPFQGGTQGIDGRFVPGVTRMEGGPITILDVAGILSGDDIINMEEIATRELMGCQ